jgi:oligopeptide transport system substrate-binding protein
VTATAAARAALVLTGFLLLCGCNRNAPEQAVAVPIGTERAATLHRGNGAEPETLDPAKADKAQEMNIIVDMMIGLMTDDARGEPIPGAAERYDVSEDGLTWTFTIRDHQWSDGKPVTAEDFVYAWQRALTPATAAEYASLLYVFKNGKAINTGAMPASALGARAIDARTLELQLENPVPYLPELLTHTTSFAVPRHVVEAKGKEWTKPGNYVGNGPYTLAEWVPNDHVTLVKNPRFYDAANVAIPRVMYFPTADYDTALRQFRAGELDQQERLPPQQIDWLRANMPEALQMVPQQRTEYLVFNLSKPPFDDARLREAISLASDREMITEKIRRLGEPPAYSVVPPTMAHYSGGPQLAFRSLSPAQRLKRAQDLMHAAGYGPDKLLRIRFSVRSTAPAERSEAAALQQMWRQIYVQADIVAADQAVFYNNLREGDFDVGKATWGADFNDARNFLYLLMGDAGDGMNYGRYHNNRFDALMRQADQERDASRRAMSMRAAEALALRDSAWAPLYFAVTGDLVQPYVRGWVPNAIDENRSRWLSLMRD